MKKLLLLFIFAVSSIFVFSQTLSLSDENGSIESGETVYVMGDPTDFIITKEISVTNNGDATVGVVVRKVETDVLAGTSNYFCWGACYAPFVFVSQDTVHIEAGQTTDEFYGDYTPAGIIGKSTIMYSWWIDENPADSVYVFVEFNASPAGLGEPANIAELKVFPVPASGSVSFEYDLRDASVEAEIVISNLLGAVVTRIPVSGHQGRISVSVADLNDGIYFYNLVNKNESIKTGKFIVRH